MGRTITVQVVHNRLLFRCPSCRSRRNMAILPNLRQKTVVCHKCRESTKCLLNRRSQPREPQAGKVVMVTGDNREFDIILHDLSLDGAGFELPTGIPKSCRVEVGSQIRLKCTWNQRLFGSGVYEVKSIQGRRIGVKRS